MQELRYLGEDAFSGYGEASVRLVDALRGTGVRVEYRAFHGAEEELGTVARLERFGRDTEPGCSVAAGTPTIAHLVPEHYRGVRNVVDGGALIAHTVWETDRLPNHWAELLNEVDAVIVPCEWNRELFAASGVTQPLLVVPHVACDPVPGDHGKGLELPDDVIVFYTIARWDQRKAPWLALRAFLDAFTADDPVAFVMKTTYELQAPALGTWGQGSAPFGTTSLEVARVLREYRRPPHVRLEVWDIGDERIAGLHTRGDCFVSLARGEGWGLGAFDACAYGNPVVTTAWGGQMEYLGSGAPGLVDFEIVPVKHHWRSSYSGNQHWAEPSVEHAVELMREVAADPEHARGQAAPLRERALRDYAPRVVAQQCIAAVDSLA
jgi:glycosyltransferase involved in cell wall biosynthesis